MNIGVGAGPPLAVIEDGDVSCGVVNWADDKEGTT